MKPVAAWRAVEDWFFAPQPMQSLVIARIVFGLCIFSDHVMRIGRVEDLYGPTGLVGPRWFHHLTNPIGRLDAAISWRIEPFLPTLTPAITAAMFGALLVSSLCFAVGFRTRLSGLLMLVLFIFFARVRMSFAYWGWAVFVMPFVLYVIAAPTGRFYSVDELLERRRRGGGPPPPLDTWKAPAWPLRLMQIHTCAMYFVAGFSRIDEPGWRRGEVVFNALSNSLFSRLTIDWQPFKPLLAIGTWGAFVLEPLAPVLFWLRRIGPVWVYLMIAMHVSLELVTNIGMWSYVMVVLCATFLPTAHLDAVLQRLPGVEPARASGGDTAIPRSPGAS